MSLIDILMLMITTAGCAAGVGYRWGSRRHSPALRIVHELKNELGAAISTRKSWTSVEVKAQVRIIFNRILTRIS